MHCVREGERGGFSRFAEEVLKQVLLPRDRTTVMAEDWREEGAHGRILRR